MKTKSSKLAAVLVLAGGIFVLSSRAVSASVSLSFQIAAPTMDFSDLDVRDHLNRKVASTARRNDLRNLFEKNLTALFLSNMLPTKRAIQFILNQSWQSMFGWLHQAAKKMTASLIAWFNPKKWAQFFVTLHTGMSQQLSQSWRPDAARINFHSLIPTLLSSTTLLR